MSLPYATVLVGQHTVTIEKLEKLRWRVSVDGRRLATFCSESRARAAGQVKANVVFAVIQDRKGRTFLSIRDQNNFDLALRKKRLMTLLQLFLMHRYKIYSVHYVTPTDDNQRQAEGMKKQGLFSVVNEEVGEIIVADVAPERVKELLAADKVALLKLITG